MTSTKSHTNYERFGQFNEPIASTNTDYHATDFEETPNESGVMIHVVDTNKARWNHIEDLDSFFSRMYYYHQKHGFMCMMLEEVFELGQFIFVVFFSTFLFHGVNYAILFKNKVVSDSKVTLDDIILPFDECVGDFGAFTWICLIFALLVWALRSIKVIYHVFQFWDIKLFFNTALKIDDSELDNLTWHEVQKRVREVQKEQQMCIHKRDLSELDIYHRILRFKNYLIAMINKNLLPIKLNVPFLNTEIVFITRGLRYNLELLLFWGPWSPFENNWHLKEDYKKIAKRHELAEVFAKHILWIGVANLVLCPLIMVWQILYSFFNNAEVIKREPGILGSYRWSLYGRLYLRHFNELDHELNARLTRAYRPASKYMKSFSSPLMTIIARNIGFICGSILAVLVLLTIYDEDVLSVEHVIMLMTALGAILGACSSLIPDENLVRCPETLLKSVLAHVHYFPDHWRGQAHTQRVRYEFSQLFQYKALYLLEELLSPVVTPYILIFKVRARALDIVDFYRNFTVAVIGVGDVCSFAQMDVRKHGHPDWQAGSRGGNGEHVEAVEPITTNQYTQAEDGKTELSLIHFTLTNPNWKMPSGAQNFVQTLKKNAVRDLNTNCLVDNPVYNSLLSVSSLGGGYQCLMQGLFNSTMLNNTSVHPSSAGVGPQNMYNIGTQQSPNFGDIGGGGGAMYSGTTNTHDNQELPVITDVNADSPSIVMRGGINRAEGPLFSERGLLYSLHQNVTNAPSMGASMFGVHAPQYLGIEQQQIENPYLEFTAADMSLSTMYLHELHHRQIRRRGVQPDVTQRSLWQRPHQQGDTPAIIIQGSQSVNVAENTPLLNKHR
ncbi:autophagy-related protein 9A [Chrysoperla carnea]|uniref:autophagy-related protein 9A n=1 Tax=Chrysoperla carnea TaxID=189513 RepID=UPI001D07ECED|nr:autophagy-related protein 9A [Chrysoperla carnea]